MSNVTLCHIWNLPGRHVIFGQERNFKNFGAGDDYFLAGSGYSFPGDPVHLVEGVRPQVAVICSANKHLQVDRFLSVANKLRNDKETEKQNLNRCEGSRSRQEVWTKKTLLTLPAFRGTVFLERLQVLRCFWHRQRK